MADELRMWIQTLRRFSVGWLFLSIWLTGIGCHPASPISGGAADEPAGSGDAATDRILVTSGGAGCSGSAACANVGAPPDGGASGAGPSDGGAFPDGGAADPRPPDAAWAGDGSVASCGVAGRAGSGGAAASSSGGAGGMAPGPAAGSGGAGAGIGGRGGSAGGQAAAGGGAAGGSPRSAGGAGGAGGLPGSLGGAGHAGTSEGASGGGVSGGAGAPGVPAPRPAELRIVELLVNPAGTDTGREWIEIANVTDHALDLAGVHVADAANDAAVDFGILGGTAPTLPAGGRAVLIQSADAGKNGGVALASGGGSGILGGAFGTRVSLNNDADSITLCAGPCRAGGITIDEITWTDLGADYDGHALSIDGAGRRCAATAPYGDAGDFGTPGAANPSCP